MFVVFIEAFVCRRDPLSVISFVVEYVEKVSCGLRAALKYLALFFVNCVLSFYGPWFTGASLIFNDF